MRREGFVQPAGTYNHPSPLPNSHFRHFEKLRNLRVYPAKMSLRIFESFAYVVWDQCSQPSRADCRALASNSPVRPGQGWYGRPGKASVLDIHRRTAG